MAAHGQFLTIGGVGICFAGRRREDLPESFADFAGGDRCACRLKVLDVPGTETDRRQPVCATQTWSLFAHGRVLRFEAYAPPAHGTRPILQADLAGDWRSGVVRVDPSICPEHTRLAPIASTLGELLLISLLNRRGGLYVHGAAVVRRGQAEVYLARSGIGKTTLSALAAGQGAEVLSDDRTVLRRARGKLLAFGTPFHSGGRRWSAKAAAVRSLVFLEQATQSHAEELSTGAAMALLASLSFGPFWDRGGLTKLLDHCARATTLAPCYRLRFRPDLSALEALDAASPDRHAHRSVRAAATAARGGATRGTPAAARPRRLDAARDSQRRSPGARPGRPR